MERLEPFEKLEDDYYLDDRNGWYGDNDNEGSESSDDDDFKRKVSKLAGIRPDRHAICQRSLTKRQHQKDEFESDMDDDLDEQLVAHASHFIATTPSVLRKGDEKAPEVSCKEAVDSEQRSISSDKAEEFSTDIDLESKTDADQKSSKKVSFAPSKTFTNEDNLLRKAADKIRLKNAGNGLADFYDPDEDDDNERWVRQHRERLKIIPPLKKSSDDAESLSCSNVKEDCKGDPEIRDDNQTDAVLSCPACMSLLTRDCQRHEFYKNQYRAIFVENCKVVTDRLLFLPQNSGKAKKWKNSKKKPSTGPKPNDYVTPSDVSGIPKEDLFYPVHCNVCSLNVGVFDHDEVYHFFDVLTGYA